MPRKRALHFKSWENYRKWLAYVHIHGLAERSPGHTPVYIRGKRHYPKHKRR
ncbi:MAG: hypothetical protein QW721_01055 [Desulfurococcaceae archaeon]